MIKPYHIDLGALVVFLAGYFVLNIWVALAFASLTYAFGYWQLSLQRKEAGNGNLSQD